MLYPDHNRTPQGVNTVKEHFQFLSPFLVMEDTRDEGAPSPAELADGIKEEMAATDPNTPGEGDVPADGDAATEDETSDDTVSEEDADGADGGDGDEEDSEDDEDLEDVYDEGKKTVPYNRLRSAIQQRNDHREREKVYKELLLQNGIDFSTGKKIEKKDGEPTRKADLSKFKPEEVENAKNLLSTLLEEKFGFIGTLKEQVEKLSESNQQRTAAEERHAVEEAKKQDDSELSEVLKKPEYKGIKKEDVMKQVRKWYRSKEPKLVALAQTDYDIIVDRFKRMQDTKSSKKKAPAPKVDASSDNGLRKPETKDDQFNDRMSFRQSIKAGAKAFMERAE